MLRLGYFIPPINNDILVYVSKPVQLLDKDKPVIHKYSSMFSHQIQ